MSARRRFVLDRSWARHGSVLVGGSPLRLLRLSTAGGRAAAELERAAAAGAEVHDAAALGLVERLVDVGALHPVPERDAAHRRHRPADVTVVTPRFGRAGADAPGPAAPGVIVVDDGSDPPIADAAVRLDPNRGPAAARNAGLAAVSTVLVAFVDDDVELEPDWLEPLLGHFDDPRVALVAPRVMSQPGPGLLARYEMAHSPLDLGAEPARISPGTRVSYVPAAALVCRRSALEEVGGFDEGLRLGEDVDLVWRLVAAGWRCRYEAASVVRHRPRAAWRAWARQRVDYASSSGPLARRHPDSLAPARLSSWSLATWLLAVSGHPVLGAVTGMGSAAALVRRLPMLPPRVAFGIAARGNLYAGAQLATAVRRAWWPVLLLAAPWSRTARRALVISALMARSPLRLADDLCASAGLWRGSVAARTAAPLLPRLTGWPGSSATV